MNILLLVIYFSHYRITLLTHCATPNCRYRNTKCEKILQSRSHLAFSPRPRAIIARSLRSFSRGSLNGRGGKSNDAGAGGGAENSQLSLPFVSRDRNFLGIPLREARELDCPTNCSWPRLARLFSLLVARAILRHGRMRGVPRKL